MGADDVRPRGISLYLATQAPDLTVDAAVEYVRVASDREFEQLFPRHDFVRPFEKRFEQPQFAGLNLTSSPSGVRRLRRSAASIHRSKRTVLSLTA
jgi:hypothetical protein